MRSAAQARSMELDFEPPPHFPVVERRLSGLALDCWRANGGNIVSGFDANSLVIADPAGHAVIVTASPAITATFGLAPGVTVDRREGFAAELAAACDFIAIQPEPVPFEASLASPGHACILVRGIALPVPGDRVQVVVSWRELLNRSATTRLRREIGVALRLAIPPRLACDPFAPEVMTPRRP